MNNLNATLTPTNMRDQNTALCNAQRCVWATT